LVSTFIAQNHITISRLFCIGALIALLLTEKMFADRLIGNLLPTVGLLPIGIAIVGRLWCSLYIGGRQ
jgi:phosphatidylglycerophosphate synthase